MGHQHFCTYFDHRYMARGIALYASLARMCPEFTLWVLTLSKEAENFLERASLANLRVVPLDFLENSDPELRDVRHSRSLVEYYFTCSPCLPHYLLGQYADIEMITYLDSDLFFFSSPEHIFSELEQSSVGITPHRFSPRAARSHARFGNYNVGWLTFRRDASGLACLAWWRARCLEWCFDRLEGNRYADQKYLDQFEELFPGVHVITHPGANLAPWNVSAHTVCLGSQELMVNDKPLVFFHFQGIRKLSKNLYDSNLAGYGARLTPVLRNHVFRPYLLALHEAEEFIHATSSSRYGDTSIRRRAKGIHGFRYTLGRATQTLVAATTNNLIRV